MDLREQLETMTLSDAGYRKLLRVAIDASVGDAVALMQGSEVGCYAIPAGGKLARNRRASAPSVALPYRSLNS